MSIKFIDNLEVFARYSDRQLRSYSTNQLASRRYKNENNFEHLGEKLQLKITLKTNI